METRNKSIDKLYKRRSRIEMPDFQRDEVWTNIKKQKLIDSILRGWKIPKLYFKIVDDGDLTYDCVDGQQMLNAIFEFYEGNVTLPEETKKLFGGITYKTLSDEYSDKFDDYELQIDEIEGANDHELEDLFLRLQLGTPLNTAEKLNAIRGNLKDFIKEQSKTAFFTNSTGVADTRYAHFSICSKMVYLATYKIPSSLRQAELEKMLKENRSFSNKSEVAVTVKNILSFMHKIFENDKKLLRNRANILSIFYFLMQFNSTELISKNIKDIKKFLYDFFDSLQKEVEKGSRAENIELIQYQDAISRNTDSRESILKRNQILLNNLANYNNKLYSNLKLERADKENFLTNKSEEISKIIREVNEDNIHKKGVDKFKLTNEVITISEILKEPISNKNSLGIIIDFLYKLIYEGSANTDRLKNPQAEIVQDIKNIRTDLRHDWRHGKPTEIKRKARLISNVYKKHSNKLTLSLLDSDDYLSLQISLYSDLIKFLKKELS